MRRIEAFSIRFLIFFDLCFSHSSGMKYIFISFFCAFHTVVYVCTYMWKYNVSITYRERAKKGHVEKKWKHRRRMKKKLFQHPWSDTWMAIYHITVKEILFIYFFSFHIIDTWSFANSKWKASDICFISKRKKKQRWNWSQINKQRNLFSIIYLHNCMRLNFLVLFLTFPSFFLLTTFLITPLCRLQYSIFHRPFYDTLNVQRWRNGKIIIFLLKKEENILFIRRMWRDLALHWHCLFTRFSFRFSIVLSSHRHSCVPCERCCCDVMRENYF